MRGETDREGETERRRDRWRGGVGEGDRQREGQREKDRERKKERQTDRERQTRNKLFY